MANIFSALQDIVFLSQQDLERKICLQKNISITFRGKLDPYTSLSAQIVSMKQVHGIDVLSADAPNFKTNECGDALYTCRSSLPIAVRTADCIPILLFSQNVVMAIHAGWRGLCAGIIKESVKKVNLTVSSVSELTAVIGPTLCAKHFEVGTDVVSAFFSDGLTLSKEERYFCLSRGVGDKFHLDLSLAASLELVRLGLKPAHILVSTDCTYCEKSTWYSYRRDKTAEHANYSIIERVL